MRNKKNSAESLVVWEKVCNFALAKCFAPSASWCWHALFAACEAASHVALRNQRRAPLCERQTLFHSCEPKFALKRLETTDRYMQRTKTNTTDTLSPYLLWDVDKDGFDVDKYPVWTIQRVLEYGDMADWNFIQSHFGIERISEACKTMRTLDPKALSFICLLSNTRKEDYRCYHIRQSNPTLWNS